MLPPAQAWPRGLHGMESQLAPSRDPLGLRGGYFISTHSSKSPLYTVGPLLSPFAGQGLNA